MYVRQANNRHDNRLSYNCHIILLLYWWCQRVTRDAD